MDAHFASLDLKSQTNDSDNELLKYYDQHFPAANLTQKDVENVLRAICDCMAKGPGFWPKRHSPGYYCVLRTIVHMRDAVKNHTEWLPNLRQAVWSAYCACFAHGASGFTTDVWSDLRQTFKDLTFNEPNFAKQLLQTIPKARIEAEADERSLTVSQMRSHTVSTMLDNLSDEVALDNTEEIQALYLDYVSHGGAEYDEIRSYWAFALGCLGRKLESSQSAPMSSSIVHFYAKDDAFMRRLLGALDSAASSDLSDDAADKLDRVVTNFGSALCATKDVDFKYLFNDAYQACFKLLSNKKTSKSGGFFLRRLTELAISKKYTLADTSSLSELVSGKANIDLIMQRPNKSDDEELTPEDEILKKARYELFQKLLPSAATTVEDMASCMPLYVKLLSVSFKQFVESIEKMYFDNAKLKLIQLNAAKFQSAFILFIEECANALTKLDESVPEEKQGDPLIYGPVQKLASILEKMIEKLYKSPGKKIVHEKVTQAKLFEVMQKMVSSRSLCLLGAIRGFDKEIFNWPALQDRFQENLDMLEAFLNDNFTTIESVHYGIGFAVIPKNKPPTVCKSMESLRKIIETCLTSDIMVTMMSGSEILSAEGLVLINLLSNLMSATSVQTAQNFIHRCQIVRCCLSTKSFYPLYVSMCRKTNEYPESGTSGIMIGLTTCLGYSPDTVFQFLPHFPLLLEFLQEQKTAGSQMFGALFVGLLQCLQLSAKTEIPDQLASRVDQLISLSEGEDTVQVQMVQFIGTVCKLNSAKSAEKMRDYLLSFLQGPYAAIALGGLASLAENQPQVMSGALDQLVTTAISNIDLVALIITTIDKGKFEAPKLMTSMCEIVNHHLAQDSEANKLTSCLALMRRVGVDSPQLLAERESDIKRWKSSPALLDACNHLLDVIANRSLVGLEGQITDQSDKIGGLERDLSDTGHKVDEVSGRVDETRDELGQVRGRVDATEGRVDELNVAVGVLGEKVEEIDLKTLSAAPAWSREVSRLMNPESDTDWRLLAQRLNFSADDIRAWATTADPCMSMLAEFYTNNRAAEASKAVLQQLKEMNRLDAAAIVEASILNAESAASDDPVEFTAPRNVFLSYQWGHQAEVKMLKQHLEKAGYRCWMDIGQMGGGDKLFSAIDAGIRSAKVVIACVTDKYSKSDNCRRELNLSVSLNKHLIPVQLERVSWPPEGAMGPLLTEYLYIRLFDRSGKASGSGGVFWPPDKFMELLVQIRLAVAPDYDSVSAEYANWWQPPSADETIVLPDRKEASKTDAKAKTSSADSRDAPPAAPQVFLSYQWSKQSEVKALYSRLCSLGFTCWMDIFQMGGGDSLYEKIDRGVRGCSVVVAFVTPKYAASPNCRREVSLADAIRKPIVPVMLEKMAWPPEGPMSMPLTQLIYVQMYKDADDQLTWRGE
uniref:Death domain-containing protein n=1 Tax=Macrostomum lignano TaxID=282301 RepID=A0A1I8I651_9PLAT